MSNSSEKWPFPTSGLFLGLAVMSLSFIPRSGEIYGYFALFVVVIPVFVVLHGFREISPIVCFFVLPILAVLISIVCSVLAKTTKGRGVVLDVGTFLTLALTGGSIASFRFMAALQT